MTELIELLMVLATTLGSLALLMLTIMMAITLWRDFRGK